MFRIGLGQDSHRFSTQADKTLVLAGIEVTDHPGLEANSDGDVIFHSLCNALSSALGGDSIGTWADKVCLEDGIKDSEKYVEYILKEVIKKGYNISNVSVCVEANKPRIPLSTIQRMKQNIARVLGLTHNAVGITFTSGEELTAFGRGEGIQVITTVLLTRHD